MIQDTHSAIKFASILVFLTLCLMTFNAIATQSTSKESYLTGADNNQIFYRMIGDHQDKNHPTIIFLHGGPGFDMNDGGYEMDDLAQHFRVIFFDQRGGGKSQAISDASLLTPMHMVEDIRAIKQHFDLDTFTLMGHSWGTGLAMLYADTYPKDVKSMILLAPMPIRQTMLQHRVTQVLKLRTPEDSAKLKALRNADLTDASVEQVIENCRSYIPIIFKPYFSPLSDWRNMKGDFCGSDPEGIKRRWNIYNQVISHIKGYDWRQNARRYYGPVYLVDGEWSMVPLNTTTEWAGYFPNARVEMVKNAGHVLWLDARDYLLNNITQFMLGNWPKNAYRLNPIDLDLLAHYRFNLSLKNSADNHFKLISEQAIDFTTDRFGNDNSSLASSSQSNQLTVKQPQWTPEQQHWSLTIWFKPSANNQAQTLITQGTDKTQLNLNVQHNQLQLRFGEITLTDPSKLAANRWTHLSVIREKDKIKLYRDGQQVAAHTAKTIPKLAGDFHLHTQAGHFDELRIYATSLSHAQVKKVYHQLSTLD